MELRAKSKQEIRDSKIDLDEMYCEAAVGRIAATFSIRLFINLALLKQQEEMTTTLIDPVFCSSLMSFGVFN